MFHILPYLVNDIAQPLAMTKSAVVLLPLRPLEVGEVVEEAAEAGHFGWFGWLVWLVGWFGWGLGVGRPRPSSEIKYVG